MLNYYLKSQLLLILVAISMANVCLFFWKTFVWLKTSLFLILPGKTAFPINKQRTQHQLTFLHRKKLQMWAVLHWSVSRLILLQIVSSLHTPTPIPYSAVSRYCLDNHLCLPWNLKGFTLCDGQQFVTTLKRKISCKQGRQFRNNKTNVQPMEVSNRLQTFRL